MSAVDTNVLIRLIITDLPAQTEAAKSKLEEGIFVSHGILMESEWVLRSVYKLDRDQIGSALRTLVAQDAVDVIDENAVLWALDRYLEGADLADMLHLVSAKNRGPFLTFDRTLARLAGDAAPVAIVLLK
ncbi:MAG: type II toxin-antitoxin system VapC family toxin [Allosphingosinicella sp.]